MHLLKLLQVFLLMAPVALSVKTGVHFAREFEAYKDDSHFMINCPKTDFKFGVATLHAYMYNTPPPNLKLSTDMLLDQTIAALKDLHQEELLRYDDEGFITQQSIEQVLGCSEGLSYMIKNRPTCAWKEWKGQFSLAQRILIDYEEEHKSRNIPAPSAPDEAKVDWMVGASERHKLDRAFVEKLQANLEKSSLAFKRDVTRCDILDKVGEYIEPFNQKLALYLEQLEFYRANKYRFEWEIFEKELRSAFTLTRSFQSSISKHNAPDRSVPFDEGLNWTTKTWKAYESVLRDMREDYITDGMMIRVLDSMDRISLAYAKCVNGN